jgi:hypothetical protein
MRTYITALMLVTTLGLVSCGGGNETSSTGTPVVAQATVWTPYSNGGCTNSISFASGCTNSQTNNKTSCGSGPALNQAQFTACNNAIQSANQSQCSALGDEVLWTGGSCQFTTCAATGQGCNVPFIPPTAAPCLVSGTYGGDGALLTATTDPTLAQCATLLVDIATGNPWNIYSNGGCLTSWNYGGNGPALSPKQFNACNSKN